MRLKASRKGRRRALKLLGAAGLSGAAAAVGFAPKANAYYSGPESDHFDGTRFFNPGGPGPKSIRSLVKWQFSERADAWPDAFASPFKDTPPASGPEGAVRLTLIGHASYLVQAEGLNILVDPVYADRAGPFALLGPKRVNPPGIEFGHLPRIDVLLITHNHYDHLDIDFIGRIFQRDKPRLVTPLGNDAIVRGSVEAIEALAVDWNTTHRLSDRVEVDVVPTQHWSARGTRDRMHALWASFVIRTPSKVVYMIGDTGFGDGGTFRHVAARHRRIDLAALPIGAYEPQWFMRDQHQNPAEAVQAMELCGALSAVGHHWGTFKLTSEAVDAPRTALGVALAEKGIPAERFKALQPGEVVVA